MKKLLIFSLLLVLVFSLFTTTVLGAGVGGTPPNPYNIWDNRSDYPYAFIYRDLALNETILIFTVSKPYVSSSSYSITFNKTDFAYPYVMFRWVSGGVSGGSAVDLGSYWDTMMVGMNTISLNIMKIDMIWTSEDILNNTGAVFFAHDPTKYQDNGAVGPEDPPYEGDDGDDGLLSGITSILRTIFDSIVNLPKNISNGIKSILYEIFVPDTDYVKNAISSFSADLRNNLNIDTSAFENLFSDSKVVEDTYVDYNISGVGTMKLKVFDASYLIQGVEYFRPIIRGFIVLLLLLYNINQLIGFFGYNAGVVTGRNDHIKSAKEKQGE